MPLPSTCNKNNLGKVIKPAGSRLPYRIDFSGWLASLQLPIASSVQEALTSVYQTIATTAGSVTITTQSFSASSSYIQISGGVQGEIAQVLVTVSTTSGNIEYFSFNVEIV
jgi:hypothetical protein